jgi:hypothetical protein
MLLDNNSARSARRISLLLALGAIGTQLVGCDKKADKAACEKMADHDYAILDASTHMTEDPNGKKLFDELKQKTIDACVGKMTMSQIDCHMAAKTTAEMTKCDEGK